MFKFSWRGIFIDKVILRPISSPINVLEDNLAYTCNCILLIEHISHTHGWFVSCY